MREKPHFRREILTQFQSNSHVTGTRCFGKDKKGQRYLISQDGGGLCNIGNKAKGQISKRVFQEDKAPQIFRKNEHFLPPDTHTYVSYPLDTHAW